MAPVGSSPACPWCAAEAFKALMAWDSWEGRSAMANDSRSRTEWLWAAVPVRVWESGTWWDGAGRSWIEAE